MSGIVTLTADPPDLNNAVLRSVNLSGQIKNYIKLVPLKKAILPPQINLHFFLSLSTVALNKTYFQGSKQYVGPRSNKMPNIRLDDGAQGGRRTVRVPTLPTLPMGEGGVSTWNFK